jgi:MOSC domain-containing protein YiiM
MQGKIISLYISKDDKNKTRELKDELLLDENGIVGDKFYAKDEQRAILISTLQSYEIARKNNIELQDGALGENILIDINPYHLLPGEKIYIGDAVLEITQNCTLCKGLATLSPKLPKLLKKDRGIFAKVTKSTSIKTGECVTL